MDGMGGRWAWELAEGREGERLQARSRVLEKPACYGSLERKQGYDVLLNDFSSVTS